MNRKMSYKNSYKNSAYSWKITDSERWKISPRTILRTIYFLDDSFFAFWALSFWRLKDIIIFQLKDFIFGLENDCIFYKKWYKKIKNCEFQSWLKKVECSVSSFFNWWKSIQIMSNYYLNLSPYQKMAVF